MAATFSQPIFDRVPSAARQCMGRSGRTIDWAIVHYMLDDFQEFGYISYDEWRELYDWFTEYQRPGGAMPGFTRFRNPYTSEMLYFPAFIDALIDMWARTINWADENMWISAGATDEDMEDPIFDPMDFWPCNIIGLIADQDRFIDTFGF